MSATFIFGVKPTGWSQLAMLLAFPLAVIFFLAYTWIAVRTCKARRLRALIAPCILLIAVPVGIGLGRPVRNLVFAHDLPRYSSAAQWATTKAVYGQEIMLVAPEAYADLGSVIVVRNTQECGLSVDFLWAVAYPVKHWLRRFAPSSDARVYKLCNGESFRMRKLAVDWYELAD